MSIKFNYDTGLIELTGNISLIGYGNLIFDSDNANINKTSSGLEIRNSTGDFYIRQRTNGVSAYITADDSSNVQYNCIRWGGGTNPNVELYYSGSSKLITTSSGISVTGTVNATAFVGDGSGLTNLPSSGGGNTVYDLLIASGVAGGIGYFDGSNPVVLNVGQDGQVLTVDSLGVGIKWSNNAYSLLASSGIAGDVIYYNGISGSPDILNAGQDGQVLTVDSLTTGIKWSNNAYGMLVSNSNPGEIVYTDNLGVPAVLTSGFQNQVLISDIDNTGTIIWADAIIPNVNTVYDLLIASGVAGGIGYFDGSNPVVLNVGQDGQVLTVDSLGVGIKWSNNAYGMLVSNSNPGEIVYTDNLGVPAVLNSGFQNQVLTSDIDNSGTIIWADANADSWNTWIVTSTAYIALNKDRLLVDTSIGAINITLPGSPIAGITRVIVSDYSLSWGTNAMTLLRNGSLFEGLSVDKIINTNGKNVELLYIDGTRGWVIVN